MVRSGGNAFPVPPAYASKYQPYILGRSAIPFISAPTGTMANNGAITLGTALPSVYANCYLFLPAGAVAAGVPAAAGWLFAQMSSTTVGTVFNNSYTSGDPTIPTTVPFVTTGPGAFTGDTAEEAGPTIAVPANAMGANGVLRIKVYWAPLSNANAKTLRVRYSGAAGTVVYGEAVTASAVLTTESLISNRAATNSQVGVTSRLTGGGAASVPSFSTSAVDTTASTSVVLSAQRATATDHIVIESYLIELLYGA